MKNILFCLLLASAGCFSLGSDAPLSERIRASVSDHWNGLMKEASKVTALTDGLKGLPESSFNPFATTKKSQRVKIRRELEKVRGLLLSTDAQQLMKEVDSIDRELASNAREARETTERRALNPDEAAACDEKLAKLIERKSLLEARRAARAKVVVAELRELGLNVSGEAAEKCLFPVNFDELVDGAVISRNIACVVENLRTLMKDGSVDASRRYYGLYLTMVDVQVATYEDYLEKSRTGEWRAGINRIRSEAEAARERALASAKDASRTVEHQQIFAHNAEVNQATIRAAEAYLGILDAHEKVIAGKLETAKRVQEVVENSYETVSLAGSFLDLANANQQAFDSLLQLDLPPIEMFDDAAVQREFLAITRKLKE